MHIKKKQVNLSNLKIQTKNESLIAKLKNYDETVPKDRNHEKTKPHLS